MQNIQNFTEEAIKAIEATGRVTFSFVGSQNEASLHGEDTAGLPVFWDESATRAEILEQYNNKGHFSYETRIGGDLWTFEA